MYSCGHGIICSMVCTTIVAAEIYFAIVVATFLPKLGSLGFLRYRAFEGFNCYIVQLQTALNTTIVETSVFELEKVNANVTSKCVDDSLSMLQSFQDVAPSFVLWESPYTDNLNQYIDEYLPLKRDVRYGDISILLAEQNELKDNIVALIGTMIEWYVKNFYIMFGINYCLLFVFMAGYGYMFYQSKKKACTHVANTVFDQLCHELKTTLTPIDMYTRELLSNKGINEAEKQFIKKHILSSIDVHRTILLRRLDLQKIMSNTYKLHLQSIELIDFVSTIVAKFEYLNTLHNKSYNITVTSGFAELFVETDKIVLYHVLMNIIQNSVKYGSGTDIDINLTCSHSRITIRVSDQGPGIPTCLLKRLNASKVGKIPSVSKSDSYGLGIRFIKRLVGLLDSGVYRISSEPGQGTVTEVSFRTVCRSFRSSISEKDVCVMIVDDCIVLRNVVSRMLRGIFTNVQAFATGEDLLQYPFQHEQTYVSILDQNMQSAGGILLGHQVSTCLKKMPGKHITISMSGNEVIGDSFDMVWDKPPPPLLDIQKQIFDIVWETKGHTTLTIHDYMNN